MLTVTHQESACGAASVHFGPMIRRTDVFIPHCSTNHREFSAFLLCKWFLLVYLLTSVFNSFYFHSCSLLWQDEGADAVRKEIIDRIERVVNVVIARLQFHHTVLSFLEIFTHTMWPVWLNSRAFARHPEGHGFESRPVCFQVTALGKLLTRKCFCHQAV